MRKKNLPAYCMAYSAPLLSPALAVPMLAIMGDEGDITTNFGYTERRGVEGGTGKSG